MPSSRWQCDEPCSGPFIYLLLRGVCLSSSWLLLLRSPAGSTSQTPCGSAAVYCLNGVSYTVAAGNYSTPAAGNATLRNGTAACPAGSYCTGGVAALCPAGYYGNTTSLSSATCTGMMCGHAAARVGRGGAESGCRAVGAALRACSSAFPLVESIAVSHTRAVDLA